MKKNVIGTTNFKIRKRKKKEEVWDVMNNMIKTKISF